MSATVDFADLVRLGFLVKRLAPDLRINERDEDIFDLLKSLLEETPPEARELLICLLEQMFVLKQYEEPCREIARRIRRKFASENILLLPICDAERKTKSGHNVHYEVSRFLYADQFSSKIELDHPESIKEMHLGFNIIFVDDFIGTGSQVRRMIKRLKERFPGIERRITIFAICVQAVSLQRIADLGCNFSPLVIRPKAIKDGAAIGNYTADEAYRLYKAIEDKLSIQVWYRLGYSRSEALVCMKRTPNNTLPVFWHMRGKGGKRWPAPFPRDL